MRQIVSASPAETRALARRLSQCLTGGDVLLLQGDLGAGKTEFVKGLAEGLQVTDLVTSPTFTLLNVYHGAMPLNHFDRYRLEDVEDRVGILEARERSLLGYVSVLRFHIDSGKGPPAPDWPEGLV